MQRPSFVNYSVVSQEIFIERMTATNPIKSIYLEADVSDTSGPEVSSMETMPIVPMAPRLLKSKETGIK